MIRTQSVVMGVRGTIFEMAFEAATKGVRVETLQGTVEVAKNQTALLTSGGLEIPAGSFITATPAGISALQSAAAAATAGGAAPATPPPVSAPIAAGAVLGALPLFGIAGLREWLPKPHLFYLDFGVLVSEDPSVPTNPLPGSGVSTHLKPSPFVSWKPGLGIPKFDDVRLRFHLGLAKRDTFLMREIGFFITGHVLSFAFAEVGWGSETWTNSSIDGSTFTINAGLLFGDSGLPDRLFVGRTTFHAAQRTVEQYRVALGFSF